MTTLLNLLAALTGHTTFARIERRLNDAAFEPAYDATRTNRLRSEIGWAN